MHSVSAMGRITSRPRLNSWSHKLGMTTAAGKKSVNVTSAAFVEHSVSINSAIPLVVQVGWVRQSLGALVL